MSPACGTSPAAAHGRDFFSWDTSSVNTAGRIVHVSLGERSYPIEIGTGNLQRSAWMMLEWQPHHARGASSPTQTCAETHAAAVARSLDAEQIAMDLLVVEPGEATKCVEMPMQLWQKLLDLGADRRTWIVAVGGGVVGDLAGFVAATFARGLSFFQVPTTLLAQVDSSVGGKVGVNLTGAKNMVGAFWQPMGRAHRHGSCWPRCPTREYRAGLAEVVKYGVILDAEFFAYLEQQAEAIASENPGCSNPSSSCCQLKAEVVAEDEREQEAGDARCSTTVTRFATRWKH